MSREAKTFWLCVLKGIAITIGGLLATALVFTLLQLRVTFLHVCLAYLCFLVGGVYRIDPVQAEGRETGA